MNLQPLFEGGGKRIGDEPPRGTVPSAIARMSARQPGSFCSPPVPSLHQHETGRCYEQPVVAAATNLSTAH